MNEPYERKNPVVVNLTAYEEKKCSPGLFQKRISVLGESRKTSDPIKSLLLFYCLKHPHHCVRKIKVQRRKKTPRQKKV